MYALVLFYTKFCMYVHLRRKINLLKKTAVQMLYEFILHAQHGYLYNASSQFLRSK